MSSMVYDCQIEKARALADEYREAMEVFARLSNTDGLMTDYRCKVIMSICGKILSGELNPEFMLVYADMILDEEEKFKGKSDSPDLPPELNSVLMDMEDEFEQFAEDFDRHVKAVAQALELYLKGSFTRDGLNEVYRRANKQLNDAYKSGLIDDSMRAEYLTDLLAAIKEVSA